jgi:O-antigen/teichoic acid export membrane protein
MSVVKRNIIANFGGSIWTGLMSLIFIPLYIRFMGIEAYGLVGIFVSLQALFALLDMGLSNTLNREMARLSAFGDKAQDMRDLLRTLELPYWGIGLFIGLLISFFSPFIAYHWIKAEGLKPETVHCALIIMGVSIGFRWPISLYAGGLRGLQHQVLTNCIMAIMATCRGAGAVLVLWLVSPTVNAFFIWQLIVSIVHIVFMAASLWGVLPKASRSPRFRWDLIVGVWRFAAGMTGITILATILAQLDKIVLSKMLSLEFFGYYMFASSVAMNINRLTKPIFTAAYPNISKLMLLKDEKHLINFYHKISQLLSVSVLPFATILILFSKEILMLWTHDIDTTQNTYILVSILLTGSTINGLMTIPYALQLASGWTSLTFFSNLLAVIILVPLIIVFTSFFGAIGAASVWVILNVGYITISIYFMHNRLMVKEKWEWYTKDVGFPLVSAVIIAFIFRFAAPTSGNYLFILVYLVFALSTTVLSTALICPATRKLLQNRLCSIIRSSPI